jgi:hypothetical protein
MELQTELINGHTIVSVKYADLNNYQQGYFYNGFDLFDLALNITMDSGYTWSIIWNNEVQGFDLEEGEELFNLVVENQRADVFDATEHWNDFLHSQVTDSKFNYLETDPPLLTEGQLNFENGRKVTFLVGDGIDESGSFPLPFTRDIMDVLFVVLDPALLDPATGGNMLMSAEPGQTTKVADLLSSNSIGFPVIPSLTFDAESIDFITALLSQLNHDLIPLNTPVEGNQEILDILEKSGILNDYSSITYFNSCLVTETGVSAHFIIADVGYTSNKSKYTTVYSEPQAIIVKNIDFDYGHILIRPESLGDKLSEIFSRAEMDFPENNRFSSKYYVQSEKPETARSFFNNSRMSLIEQHDGLFIEIMGNFLIAKYIKILNVEDCRLLLDLARKI